MEGFIGEVRMFGGNFAPRSWAFCDGQLLPISQYDALFSILGTIYGGDGRTTFALPDLRGRVPVGPGNGPGLTSRREGTRGGSETNTLTILNLPSHSHPTTMTLNGGLVVGGRGSEDDPTGNYVGGATGLYRSNAGTGNLNGATALNPQLNIGTSGGQQPINNVQPVQVVNYIIALQGTYPSRS